MKEEKLNIDIDEVINHFERCIGVEKNILEKFKRGDKYVVKKRIACYEMAIDALHRMKELKEK